MIEWLFAPLWASLNKSLLRRAGKYWSTRSQAVRQRYMLGGYSLVLASTFAAGGFFLSQWKYDAAQQLDKAFVQRQTEQLRGSLLSVNERAWRIASSDPNAQPDVYQAWPVAQIALSLHGILDPSLTGSTIATSDSVADALLVRRSPNDGYWKQLNQPTDPPSSVVHAWVSLTLARFGSPQVDAEVAALLAERTKASAWSDYPGTSDLNGGRAELSSTYATCIAMLALDTALDGAELSPSTRRDSAIALREAALWLRANRVSDGALRWRYSDSTSPSQLRSTGLGISALAFHALLCATARAPDDHQLRDLADDWIETLPEAVPTPLASSSSNSWRQLPNGVQEVDRIRNFEWPWMMIATHDAMKYCSPKHKAAAERWIDRCISQDVSFPEYLADTPWLAAECLFAVRYVTGEQGGLLEP
ncbi:MAG: hypothetical protein R3B57_08195 [Phycisphaerales bacterium]